MVSMGPTSNTDSPSDLPDGPFRASFLPKLGVSYADHPILEVPQRTQLGPGAQILLGYEDFRIGLECLATLQWQWPGAQCL